MKKSFEANSFLLFILMMTANACNYLFQIVMGRLLTNVNDYAVVNTLLSLIMYFSIPNTIVLTLSAKYIAHFTALQDNRNLVAVLRFLLKLSFIIGFVELIVGLFASDSINSVFVINSSGLVVMCIFISITNLLVSISSGILQGQQRFKEYGTQSIINAFVKLVGSICFVLLGYKLWGIMISIFLGGVLAFVYCILPNLQLVPQIINCTTRFRVDRQVSIYIIETAVAQSCIIALTYGDMLVVQALFPEEAGMYSSAMVIGKIAMYVSTAVVATLFPMVIERHAQNKSTLSLFYKALLIGGGAAVAIALGMICFGKYIIPILFGSKYADALLFLTPVSCFVIAVTFLTIVMNYSLAIENALFFSVSTFISIVLVGVIIYFWHSSINSVLYISALLLLLNAFINITQCIYVHTKTHREKINELQ